MYNALTTLCLLLCLMVNNGKGCHTYNADQPINKRQVDDSMRVEELRRTKFLRDYFTACLEDVVDPTQLDSGMNWRTNVDFSVLETPWYINSAEIDCGFGDTDECWKDVLIRYLSEDTNLVNFVRICIDDYVTDVARSDGVLQHNLQTQRQKRQVPNRPESLNSYPACISELTVTRFDMPPFDFESLASFIQIHTTNQTCRSTPNIPNRNWPSRFVALTRTDSDLRMPVRECGLVFFPQDFPNPRPDVPNPNCPSGNCPISDGSWELWETWTFCTQTCGGGTRIRERLCSYNGQKNRPIPASLCQCAYGSEGSETESCNMASCTGENPTSSFSWGEWGPYSPCTASCRGGSRVRNRSCKDSRDNTVGSNSCEGSSSSTMICNTQTCQPSATWGQWGSYSLCTVTCGGGSRVRGRSCTDENGGNVNANLCGGNGFETQSCNSQTCEARNTWGAWSLYTECSASCGNGVQERERVCSDERNIIVNLNLCPGSDKERISCFLSSCTPLYSWGSWSNYSPCSFTCGSGTQSRFRSCLNFADTVLQVTSSLCGEQTATRDTRPCIGIPPCSTPSTTTPPTRYTSWSNWTRCSASCGPPLTRSRVRCPITNDNSCPNPEFEEQPCPGGPCIRPQ